MLMYLGQSINDLACLHHEGCIRDLVVSPVVHVVKDAGERRPSLFVSLLLFVQILLESLGTWC